MILTNITKALREQNWLAVAIEFVIVILGVVVGFQVTAWNAGRETVVREQSYLVRIEADLRRDIEEIDAYMLRVRGQAAAAQRMIAYHDAGDLSDLNAYNRDLTLVFYYAPHRPHYGSLEALKGAGELGLLSNIRLVTLLLDIEDLYADFEFNHEHIYQDLWAYLYTPYADIADLQLGIDALDGEADPELLSGDVVAQARTSPRIKNGFTLINFMSQVQLDLLEDIRAHAVLALEEIEASR